MGFQKIQLGIALATWAFTAPVSGEVGAPLIQEARVTGLNRLGTDQFGWSVAASGLEAGDVIVVDGGGEEVTTGKCHFGGNALAAVLRTACMPSVLSPPLMFCMTM